MSDAVKHGQVEVNGVRLHLAAGRDAAAVLPPNGYPESRSSWRPARRPAEVNAALLGFLDTLEG